MDYNQPDKQNRNPDFFTAGVSTNNPEVNNFEPENNLDLSNTKANWQESPMSNNQEIGNKVIDASKEQIMPPNSAESSMELGQVIDLEPSKPESMAKVSADTIARTPYNKEVIKTGDILSKEGIREMDRVIKEFEKSGNAANFYDMARDMTEVHLDNSYNRILGEKTGNSSNEGMVA